jgi:hypothetical protein
VYNHLPRIDPTRSLEARHRVSGSEQDELRRQQREHVAAREAARRRRARRNLLPARFGAHNLVRPALISALIAGAFGVGHAL